MLGKMTEILHDQIKKQEKNIIPKLYFDRTIKKN
jgi:hypothetical protein